MYLVASNLIHYSDQKANNSSLEVVHGMHGQTNYKRHQSLYF